MATKTKKAPIQIFVRRGALKRFDSLKRATANLPVTLTWDRRTAERRSGQGTATTDRRKSDRRQKPTFTWDVADFVVVESEPEGESQPTVPKARKKR